MTMKCICIYFGIFIVFWKNILKKPPRKIATEGDRLSPTRYATEADDLKTWHKLQN